MLWYYNKEKIIFFKSQLTVESNYNMLARTRGFARLVINIKSLNAGNLFETLYFLVSLYNFTRVKLFVF